MDIQYIKGVGPAVAKKLENLGLTSTKDILTFFPSAYQDRRKIPNIIDLKLDEDQFVLGKVRGVAETRKGKYHLTKAMITDDTGQIGCVWFNQPFIKKILQIGTPLFISGKVEIDPVSRCKILKVSEYELANEHNTGRIMPIYPLTKGIYQRQLRAIVDKALRMELKDLQDPFPEEMLGKYQLMSLPKATWYFHYPADEKTYLQAKKRLVIEDFFYLQLALAITRNRTRGEEKGIAFEPRQTLSKAYFDSLPYQLTSAQKRVINEVLEDMMRDRPMNRLVQGDVGAGKTEVAMAAILLAIENNYQVAIMAPTEILAYQHYQKMCKYLVPLGIRVELLVGSLQQQVKTRKQYLVASGSAQVVVGTHAIIQEKVNYDRLGLAIIDEQHRFGVLQRSALMKKSGEVIDLLVITATPIPRTLTLTLYGDLDKSILYEMPPGRTPIKTVWLKKMDRPTLAYISTEVEKGNQVYWVFPLVEESEKIDLKAATEGRDHIQQSVFPQFRVGLIHGRLKQRDKDEIMRQFRGKELDILVTTTVIEVGVDVPNATVMIIEHAERFGLSQLHQLRGRIGRSDKPSSCILLSTTRTDVSRQRLQALVDSTDGFKLAEVDLQLRGPGDYFGAKQSGLPTMYVANLLKDEKVLLESKKIAEEVAEHIGEPVYRNVMAALKKKPHLYVGNEGMN